LIGTLDQGIAILDFGSQYTQLIARRLRELGIFCEIFAFHKDLTELKVSKPRGIVLSGGPFSVYEDGAPTTDVKKLAQIAPILGVCYGMQLVTHQLGGKVEKAQAREYGLMPVNWSYSFSKDIPHVQKVWMSHGDIVKAPPVGFQIIAKSEQGHPAVVVSNEMLLTQFHPEVAHTEHGEEILRHFAFEMCHCQKTWSPSSIADSLIEEIKNKVGPKDHVLCALSGGVDSTVTATLLTRALGPKAVHCVFVDHGLLRKNEYQEVMEIYRKLQLNVVGVDASETFFAKLKGVTDPEQKRKIIGHQFIVAFESVKKELKNVEWLAQGTLYPDVIESVSIRGANQTIKTHHNVGGLPKNMKMKLIEPLRELFKDEVRRLGDHLAIPKEFLWRHPFPGPGLAVRILGDITREKVRILQEADSIFIENLRASGLYSQIWQAFAVLLPVQSVGVQGDARTYDRAIALRAVTSVDGMTADWFHFDDKFLRKVSNQITNQVSGINRVVLDITSKPPSTIEWE
jgi:GMP synthase (glutamine-hydrolysing)